MRKNEMNIDKSKFKEVYDAGDRTFGLLILNKAQISKFNVRPNTTIEDVHELAKSISKEGMLQIPLSTPDGEIFGGGMRLKAIESLGKTLIYVQIVNKSPNEMARASLAENLVRRSMSVNEEGKLLKMISRDDDMTYREMEAEGLGGRSSISTKIRIYETFGEKSSDHQADKDFTEVVYGSGSSTSPRTMTYKKARHLIHVEKKDRNILVEKIKDKGLTGKELGASIDRVKRIRQWIENMPNEKAQIKVRKAVESTIWSKEMTLDLVKDVILKAEGLWISTPKLLIAWANLKPQLDNFKAMFPKEVNFSRIDTTEKIEHILKVNISKKLLEIKEDE